MEGQREAIRAVATAGLEAGRNPRNVALDIVGRVSRQTGRREGGVIGLHGQFARAVVGARVELEGLSPDYFARVRRDRRFDRLVSRAIRDGVPLAQADIDRIAGRYSDSLLQLRGETVARTETIAALNAGREEGIEQLVDTGAVQRQDVKKVWRATLDARTRDTHAGMNGQEVELGGLFTAPSGARLAHPGDTDHGAPAEETINCRCTYVIEVDFLAAQARRERVALV